VNGRQSIDSEAQFQAFKQQYAKQYDSVEGNSSCFLAFCVIYSSEDCSFTASLESLVM
jgi:hypothetical protein